MLTTTQLSLLSLQLSFNCFLLLPLVLLSFKLSVLSSTAATEWNTSPVKILLLVKAGLFIWFLGWGKLHNTVSNDSCVCESWRKLWRLLQQSTGRTFLTSLTRFKVSLSNYYSFCLVCFWLKNGVSPDLLRKFTISLQLNNFFKIYIIFFCK